MSAADSVGEYARGRARLLLGRLAQQVERSAADPNPDAIHDLRVSIRRFGQCLRVFGQFFPAGRRKRVRKRLRKTMDLAADVRDRDIALELLAEAGLPEESPVVRQLADERRGAGKRLAAAVRRWHDKDFSGKWRTQLEL